MSATAGFSRKSPGALLFLLPLLLVLLQAAFLDHLNRLELGRGLPIDDGYIFKRYAENLAAGQGFSFNPGEVSFGGTSLLWPLVNAALLKLFPGAGFVGIAFWLGAALSAAAAGALAFLVLKVTRNFLLGLMAGLVAASSPLVFMNAVSGMETPLTFFLLAVFAALVLAQKPRPLAAGVLAGLLTLNRPEGLFFVVAAVMAWALSLMRKEGRLPFASLVKFLAAWSLLAVPAGLYLYHHSGSFLPTTYLGKIMSTAPGLIDRSFPERLFTGTLSLLDGWLQLSVRLRLLALVIIAGIVFEGVRCLRALRSEGPAAWPLFGRLILIGYLSLPAAYGLSFPVGPAFGGYYIRYIAPVHLMAALVGAMGIAALGGILAGKSDLLAKYKIPVQAALALSAILYLAWLWSFQFPDAVRVYRQEVRLNTGLRMEAARWIAENTPAEARVMAGYTGLGVVGGECGRYTLDQGALINPDIFAYYQRVQREQGLDKEGRWRVVVEYMRDRELDYYVTFATSPELTDAIFDPARTPGFVEVKRLGAEPSRTGLDQIRIYRFDRSKSE